MGRPHLAARSDRALHAWRPAASGSTVSLAAWHSAVSCVQVERHQFRAHPDPGEPIPGMQWLKGGVPRYWMFQVRLTSPAACPCPIAGRHSHLAPAYAQQLLHPPPGCSAATHAAEPAAAEHWPVWQDTWVDVSTLTPVIDEAIAAVKSRG